MLENSKARGPTKVKGWLRTSGWKILYITFNGYYPAIGAHMTTCSFKETEAYSVCARIDENEGCLSASAGTARAFAKVCSDKRIHAVLRCLPTTSMPCGSTDRWIAGVKLDLFGEGRRLFRCDPFEQPRTQER